MMQYTVLVVDNDAHSYRVIQNAFIQDAVQVIWLSFADLAQTGLANIPQVDFLLVGVEAFDDYNRLFDLHQSQPNAIAFLLAKPTAYDAFESRNSGAIGAFMKPLHGHKMYQRLIELMPNLQTKGVEDVYVPTSSHLDAKIFSFVSNSPIKEDVHSLVEEILPVVTEQLLRIQLLNHTKVREALLVDVRRIVQEELRQLLLKPDEGNATGEVPKS